MQSCPGKVCRVCPRSIIKSPVAGEIAGELFTPRMKRGDKTLINIVVNIERRGEFEISYNSLVRAERTRGIFE